MFLKLGEFGGELDIDVDIFVGQQLKSDVLDQFMDLFYVVDFELFLVGIVDLLIGFVEVIVMFELELLMLMKEVLLDVVRSSEFFFSSFVRSLIGDDFVFVGSDEGFSILELVVVCEINIQDILDKVYNKLSFGDFFFVVDIVVESKIVD